MRMSVSGLTWRSSSWENVWSSVLVQMSPEEETERLRVQLKEREEQLHQAAQAGLDLLNQQVELQSRLDEQRVEMTNALEVWR